MTNMHNSQLMHKMVLQYCDESGEAGEIGELSHPDQKTVSISSCSAMLQLPE